MTSINEIFSRFQSDSSSGSETILEINTLSYQKVRYNILIFSLISLYITYILSHFFSLYLLIPWLAAILSVNLFRLLIYIIFNRSPEDVRGNIIWQRMYVATGMISSLIWASGGFFFFPESFTHQILIMGFITIVATFMAVYFNLHKYASQISVGMIMTPLIIRFILSTNPIGLQLGTILGIYSAILIFYSISVSKSNKSTLTLSIQNKNLLIKFKTLFEEHKNILETSPVGMIKMNRNLFIEYMNPVAKDILGIPEDDTRINKIKINRLPAVKKSGLLPYLEKILSGSSIAVETYYISPHRENLFLSIHGIPLYDDDGFAGSIITLDDISRYKASEMALYTEKERAHVILNSINDLVASIDINGITEFATPSFREYLGWGPDELAGKNFFETITFIDEENGIPLINPLKSFIEKNQHLRLTQPITVYNRKGDKSFSVELTIAPIHDKDMNITGAVVAIHDISDLRILTEKLSYQATHDPLTGLVNRSEFERRISAALLTAQIDNKKHVMCYLDMDQFKIINDTCGHAGGDELLRQITPVLHNSIRSSDTLARLGGDEFGILMNNCSAERGKELLLQIQDKIRNFKFSWLGQVFDVGMSMGMIEISSENSSISEIFSNADSACYVAKENGRNRLHVYSKDDNALLNHRGNMQWFNRLQRGIEKDDFLLFFQPIQKLNPGNKSPNIAGEFLLRMLDEKTQELISPGLFIPAAERYQLMPAIDGWVIRNIFRNLSEIPKKLLGDSICTINISAQSIGEEYYTAFISSLLKQYRINPKNICFEITETTAFSNINLAVEFMTALKKMGFYFALDDFGSGISSLINLKLLPIDFLKIDGEFIKSITRDNTDQIMVDSIIQICRVMKLHTIAEFVEDKKILSLLKKKNVTYAQGFVIAKPQRFSPEMLTGKIAKSTRTRKHVKG